MNIQSTPFAEFGEQAGGNREIRERKKANNLIIYIMVKDDLVKQAYEYAKDAYEGFIITSCTELEDSWVFFANAKKDIAFIPPLEIMKSGKDLDVWKKYHQFNNCFEAAE